MVLWLLSAERFTYRPDGLPYLALLAGPVVALAAIAFLQRASQLELRRAALAGGGLILAVVYVMLLSPSRTNYRVLMVPHLFLLSWAAVGVSALGLERTAREVHAFLIKTIEAVVTGGVYMIALFVFSGITLGMFEALNVGVPNSIMRLLFVGLGGIVPLLAVASVYDPTSGPADQEFNRGVGRLIMTLPRLLLGLTLVVLVAYLFAIPFNFRAPFEDRQVLIVYNVMLFAVMGLLVGATPVSEDGLTERQQNLLRAGILAVALLVVVVSLYALSAVAYRTLVDALTMNRLAVIGWNTINIVLLALLIARLVRGERSRWVEALQSIFRAAIVPYIAWTVFLLIATPWLF